MSPRNETELLAATIDLAKLQGWMVCHFRPALTRAGWRTAVQGHGGAPDLLLARDGVAHHWELKSKGGRLTGMQERWISHLPNARVVRPSDWDWVVETLTARRS